MDNYSLPTYLIEILNTKGWSQAELARRAKVSKAMVSDVISGKERPGYKFCKGIASAIDRPVDEVLRAATLKPVMPESDELTERGKNYLEGFRNPEIKKRAVEYLEFLSLQDKKEGESVIPNQRTASSEQSK
jgi:transcriptional regulator with XRE-family HTH domain